jgi:hemoglobin/transferrin/lactoferrin receptor protein
MKHTLTLMLILCSFYAIAQKVQVIGKSDIQPVSNCLIYNQDKSITTTTNNEGIAELNAFKNSDKLTFSHISYNLAEYDKSFFKTGITEISLNEAVPSIFWVTGFRNL